MVNLLIKIDSVCSLYTERKWVSSVIRRKWRGEFLFLLLLILLLPSWKLSSSALWRTWLKASASNSSASRPSSPRPSPRSAARSSPPIPKASPPPSKSSPTSLPFTDMSWAGFHVVEVMSSSRFFHKRIGYHAASLSFHDDTPVLLLITNQLRKDLASTNEFEVSLALECLSKIATPDLARDLTPEIFTLLSTTKIFVRKKAITVLLIVFAKYPDAVRVCFKRLVENLDSSDPQILAAVVGVFCKLASQDPGSYLPLAPEFYRILVDSKNNWVLIKVLKIFAKLAPLEPRLAKRVVEPICDNMRRTGAKSLMFECIRTVVSSFSEYESAVKLAVVKIWELLVDDYPNIYWVAGTFSYCPKAFVGSVGEQGGCD